MSDTVLSSLMPSLVSYSIADSERELFKKTSYPAFDLVSAADTASGLTFDALLNPVRAARMIELNRRDSSQLGFDELLQTVSDYVMQAPTAGRKGEITRAVQSRFVYDLMELADNGAATPAVKTRVNRTMSRLSKNFSRINSDHAAYMVSEIRRFESRPAKAVSSVTPEKVLPPGSPIGTDEMCWHCESE